MAKRKTLSKKARFEIFKRDGFVCQYCGAHPPMAVLHVDHIIPVAGGGSNEETNLVTACDQCNLGKSANSLDSVPSSLASRAADVAEREEQLKGYSAVMAAQRSRIEEDAWQVADIFIEHFRDDGIRKDWMQSIKRFVTKLDVDRCIRAMEAAIAKKPWSKNACFAYFCGICWNVIREDGYVS